MANEIITIKNIKVIVTDSNGHEDVFLDRDTPNGAQASIEFGNSRTYRPGNFRPILYYTGEVVCRIVIHGDPEAEVRALAEAEKAL